MAKKKKSKKKDDEGPVSTDMDKMIESMTKDADAIRESTPSDQIKHVSSGNIAVNLCLSGDPSSAIPMGKIVNLEGESDTGKSLLALTILREGQIDHQELFRGLIVDTERAFDERRTEEMGLFLRRKPKDPKNPKVDEGEDDTNDPRASTCRIIQTTDLTTLAEVVVPRFFRMARDHPEMIFFILIDSMSMVVTAHEREATFETRDMARAQEIRKFMRLLNDQFPNNLSVILTHHQTDRIATGGSRLAAKTGNHMKDIGGGKAVKYTPDIRIEIDYKGREVRGSGANERIVGQKCRVKVIKNRGYPPMVEAVVVINHEKGFTATSGLFDQLVQLKLIVPTGKMYKCPDILGDRKWYAKALEDELEKPEHAAQVAQLIVDVLESGKFSSRLDDTKPAAAEGEEDDPLGLKELTGD